MKMNKKAIITIILSLVAVIGQGQTQLSKQVLPSCGLTDTKWRNEKSGDWDIAFFEDFAVYDCKFWDYESIKGKGDKRYPVENSSIYNFDCLILIIAVG